MAALSRIVGGSRTSTLVPASSPFNPGGTISGEDSRTSYTTANSTACTRINAHALSINDDYHKVLLLVPNTVDTAAVTPVVFVFHGVGNDETIVMPSGKVGGNGLTDSWLDQGWIVMSFTMGGTTWGNEASREGIIDADFWFAQSFTGAAPLLYGVSMGACSALNYLLDVQLAVGTVAGVALNSAATNFQYTFDNNSTLRPAMRTAYGLASGVISSDAAYIAAVDTADGGHDPQKQTAAEFPTAPFAFYTGTADTTISKPNNVDLFVTKLQNASWVPEIHEVTTGGGHTADGLFQPADTLSFFQRALDAL